MKTGTITALAGCQFTECAFEVSYPLDMLKMYNGSAICEGCYDELISDRIAWDELPDISLEDLRV